MTNTVTWDESNPGDIICVVGANGKSQAIHGRTVAETQGRIPKVMVSEFRMSQPEADEFAKMAAKQRTRAAAALNDQAEALRHAQELAKALTQRSQKMEGLLAAAEADRDGAIAERDKALKELSEAKTALRQAQNQMAAMPKAHEPPPASNPDDSNSAETGNDGKADKAS